MKSHMSLYGHYVKKVCFPDNNIEFILFNLSTEWAIFCCKRKSSEEARYTRQRIWEG